MQDPWGRKEAFEMIRERACGEATNHRPLAPVETTPRDRIARDGFLIDSGMIEHGVTIREDGIGTAVQGVEIGSAETGEMEVGLACNDRDVR